MSSNVQRIGERVPEVVVVGGLDPSAVRSGAGPKSAGRSDVHKVGAVGSVQVDVGRSWYRIPVLTPRSLGAWRADRPCLPLGRALNAWSVQGFSVGGMSGITRCRQTQETDGSNDGIGLDAGDRFCLDGRASCCRKRDDVRCRKQRVPHGDPDTYVQSGRQGWHCRQPRCTLRCGGSRTACLFHLREYG